MRPTCLAALVAASLLAATVESQSKAPRPPGYYNGWPSAAAQEVLQELYGTTYADRTGRFGGGEWWVDGGGIYPYPLGPGMAKTLKMGRICVKGPHIEFTQGERSWRFPAESDGDVASVWKMVHGKEHETIHGKLSANHQRALRIVDALGEVAGGLRLNLRLPHSDDGEPLVLTAASVAAALVFADSDDRRDVQGQAWIEAGHARLPVVLRSGKRWAAPDNVSRIVLAGGEGTDLSVKLGGDRWSLGERSGRLAELLPAGVHELRLVLEMKSKGSAAVFSVLSKPVKIRLAPGFGG